MGMSKEWYPSALHHARLGALLLELKGMSSYFMMNYGEDSDNWEVSLVIGKDRYTSVSTHLLNALEDVEKQVKAVTA